LARAQEALPREEQFSQNWKKQQARINRLNKKIDKAM
jgi:hypothetical protein